MLCVLGAGIFFSSPKWPNHFWPTQSPIQWIPVASVQATKWQGHEAECLSEDSFVTLP